MHHMLCRQRVRDFHRWKSVFDSHLIAQREAGLFVQHVWRNLEDPDEVFFLFEVTDLSRARSFVTAPDVPRAVEESGAAGPAEVFFLSSQDAAGSAKRP